MKNAVFLDRDGTVIELVHHLTEASDVKLIDGAGSAIAGLRADGWTVVIVTNQSVIGRGKLDEKGLETVHDEMLNQLAEYGADIDGIYFCPLAPQMKDPTVIENVMRKPGPGMLQQAAKEMDLDLSGSWMVGDTVSDMLAGRNAGCKTILVRTGYGSEFSHDKGCIDRESVDIYDAAATILGKEIR